MQSPLEMNDGPEQDRLSEALQGFVNAAGSEGGGTKKSFDDLKGSSLDPEGLEEVDPLEQQWTNKFDIATEEERMMLQHELPSNLLNTSSIKGYERKIRELDTTISELESLPKSMRPQVESTLSRAKSSREWRQDAINEKRSAIERRFKRDPNSEEPLSPEDIDLENEIQNNRIMNEYINDVTALFTGNLSMEEAMQIGNKYDPNFSKRMNAITQQRAEPTEEDLMVELQADMPMEETGEMGDMPMEDMGEG